MIDRRWAWGAGVVVVAFAAAALWRSRGPGEQGAAAAGVPVHVDQLRRATVRRTVTAYGTVEPVPALEGQPPGGAVITPFTDGVVAEVDMVEGRRVKKGTVLVRLDSRMARAALARARSQAEVAEKAFQRQEKLLGSDGTSQREYLDAKARRDAARADLVEAETGLSYLNIEAPLAGTVLHVQASVGQHVDAGTVLAQVVNLDRLVVTAGVPARQVAGIQVGQTVFVGVGDSLPQGKVVVLGSDVDPATGTYRVQAALPPDTGLMPGQFTQIAIVAEEHADVLVAPEESVITRPDEGTWLVVVEDGRAVHRAVTTGLRDGGLVEVSGDGVEEGTRIVTDEAYGLPSDTPVRIQGG